MSTRAKTTRSPSCGIPKRESTTEEVAELLDVDRATILRWSGEGLPHDKPQKKQAGNRYDVAEVAAWMKANNRTGEVGRPADSDSALVGHKTRKEKALADRYERENAVAAGLLIDAAAEQKRDIQKITLVRNRLCGLGAALSPQLEGLDGAQRQSAIDAAVEEILQEFSRA